MTWAGGFVILVALTFIYEMVIKGEKVQQKIDEEKAINHRLREEQIENDRIQILNENLKLTNEKSKLRNENSRVVSTEVGLNNYLSKDQLQISLLTIAVGIIFIILYFKLIHFN